jgi:hypothetical protein
MVVNNLRITSEDGKVVKRAMKFYLKSLTPVSLLPPMIGKIAGIRLEGWIHGQEEGRMGKLMERTALEKMKGKEYI